MLSLIFPAHAEPRQECNFKRLVPVHASASLRSTQHANSYGILYVYKQTIIHRRQHKSSIGNQKNALKIQPTDWQFIFGKQPGATTFTSSGWGRRNTKRKRKKRSQKGHGRQRKEKQTKMKDKERTEDKKERKGKEKKAATLKKEPLNLNVMERIDLNVKQTTERRAT